MQVDIYNSNKKYNIIYADPPWQYKDKKCSGNCAKHYKCMTVKDICNLPIADISDRDCVLLIWATYPILNEALKVIDAWGFKYTSIAFQWVKQNKSGQGFHFGVGHWTRSNTEPCLLATKGKPYKYIQSKSESQLIISPIREHSRKPDEVRDKITKLFGSLPKIELFARQQIDGWDCWGNEIEKYSNYIHHKHDTAQQ